MRTLIALAVMLTITPCFASVSKVDDNSLKMTIEQVYTYDQIQSRIDQLKSERDGQQSNLNLLNAEIARLEKMIEDTGIKAQPVENSEIIEGEATEEKGE